LHICVSVCELKKSQPNDGNTVFFAKSFLIGTLRKVVKYSRTHSSIFFEYRRGSCMQISEELMNTVVNHVTFGQNARDMSTHKFMHHITWGHHRTNNWTQQLNAAADCMRLLAAHEPFWSGCTRGLAEMSLSLGLGLAAPAHGTWAFTYWCLASHGP
jgi:hypothetical protein